MYEKNLVSVIVPIYNSEKYLDSCINSVLVQSYKQIELILIDDGSTDSSLEICRKYENIDSRITVIHQDNKGVSAARNAGIESSKGEYITFLDSDDVLLPDAVEITVDDILKYGADIVSAVKCKVYPDGRTENPYEDGKIKVYKGEEALKLSLNKDVNTNSVFTKLYRHSFIEGIRFVEGRKVNEDGYFLFQCYAKQPVLVQDNVCIYQYNVVDGSASRSPFSDKYLDMLYFCELKKDYVEKFCPHLRTDFLQTYVNTHFLFLMLLFKTNEKKYKEYEKKCIGIIRENHKKYNPVQPHEKKYIKAVAYGFYPILKLIYRLKNGII